jgi:site-specific recombinase XerD
MQLAGNQGNTIATRLWEVRTALGIMCPGVDFRWITSPDGNDVRGLFPFERRPVRIYHPRLLYRSAHELMDGAVRITPPEGRAVQYRNGLLIAIFAARAPRLRSMAAVRLGVQIMRQDDRFRLVFGKRDLKRKNALEYDLPADLTPRIEHYLTIERPILLARQPALLGKPDHGWFWVGQHGLRLSATGIEVMIRRESLKRFGAAFGPHRFRHAAGTRAPISDPARPGAVAAMLGNSKAVLEKVYNLGQQQEAARQFQASLKKERQRLEGVALRAFGRAEKPQRTRR